jgi:fumarate hydratase class I
LLEENIMELAKIFNQNFTSEKTAFRKIQCDGTRVESYNNRKVLRIEPKTLRLLASEAFRDINFLLRTSHLEGWAGVLENPAASANDRFVAATLLKNAALSAEGVLPLCQDTGTATVVAFKGESVFTGGDDAVELESGIRETYAGRNLRFSQTAPLSMFEERNTGNNLPAQIDIYSASGEEYQFLFVAKGGGSSNKTSLFQETKALLNEESFAQFLQEKVRALGVAACPPYHLGLVVGGTSPEFNLKMLKLATAGALDHLPEESDGGGTPYRDRLWERRLVEIAAETGLGAQFGGKYLAFTARVIRCARHGGSCPVSLGVSCSAHRNALAKISADGIFLEQFDGDPARFLPRAIETLRQVEAASPAAIDLDQPMREVCQSLSHYASGTMVLLNGTMIVARDAAHARFYQLLKEGRPLPEYLLRHPIYYAGPAETPPGHVIGSFGPTTAQRMDGYLPDFMARGASFITLAKGNRSAAVTEA